MLWNRLWSAREGRQLDAFDTAAYTKARLGGPGIKDLPATSATEHAAVIMLLAARRPIPFLFPRTGYVKCMDDRHAPNACMDLLVALRVHQVMSGRCVGW